MKNQNDCLHKLLEDQLKDLYSAENQLVKALPKMAKSASTDGLREAIESHLEETKGHVERLDEVGQQLGIRLTGKKCAGMEGLIEEGKECLEELDAGAIRDLAIVAAAQRVEHYEMAAYGNARAIAEQMGESEAVNLLQETLDEESAANEKLTQVSQSELFTEAKSCAEEGEMEEESNGRKTTSQSSRSKQNGRGSMSRSGSRR